MDDILKMRRQLARTRDENRRAKKLLAAAERELSLTGTMPEEMAKALRRELTKQVRRRNAELLAGEAAGNA